MTSDLPRVVGLDISLTGTGIATPTTADTITPGGRRGIERIQYIRDCILGDLLDHEPDLVVIEGPSYGSQGGQAHDRAGLWWAVRLLCVEAYPVPVAVVPPATLKRYATGRGNADKAAMAVAAYKRLGRELADDNRVDALWLRAAGMDHLGHPLAPMPATHRAALDRVAWPDVPESPAGGAASGRRPPRRDDDEPSTTGLHLTVNDQPDPLTPWVAHLEAPDGQRLRRPVETAWIPGVSGDRE